MLGMVIVVIHEFVLPEAFSLVFTEPGPYPQGDTIYFGALDTYAMTIFLMNGIGDAERFAT